VSENASLLFFIGEVRLARKNDSLFPGCVKNEAVFEDFCAVFHTFAIYSSVSWHLLFFIGEYEAL